MKTKKTCRRDGRFEIADIFRLYGEEEYLRHNQCSYEQFKVMRHIIGCRTAAMGGHIEMCDECGFQHNAYNSCRDRHCPKCRIMVKEKWLCKQRGQVFILDRFCCIVIKGR